MWQRFYAVDDVGYMKSVNFGWELQQMFGIQGLGQ